MAEFLLKDMTKGLNETFIIESSGTSAEEEGNDIHYGTKRILDEKNVPYEKRKAKRFKKSDYDNFDYIVCMDAYNVRSLTRIVDDRKNKVKMLMEYCGEKRDIDDPWYSGDFAKTYRDINKGLTCFLEAIYKV